MKNFMKAVLSIVLFMFMVSGLFLGIANSQSPPVDVSGSYEVFAVEKSKEFSASTEEIYKERGKILADLFIYPLETAAPIYVGDCIDCNWRFVFNFMNYDPIHFDVSLKNNSIDGLFVGDGKFVIWAGPADASRYNARMQLSGSFLYKNTLIKTITGTIVLKTSSFDGIYFSYINFTAKPKKP